MSTPEHGASTALFHQHGGAVMRFDQLPQAARKAVHHYMVVDGERPGYADELLYGFVMLPAEDLKAVCWNAPDNDIRDDYPDWGAYADWYWSGVDDADYRLHLLDKWPVILDDREGIQDGWHRLHWYLRNGVSEIPAILCVEPEPAYV